MPPSGFNQDVIDGLLIFVREVYRKALDSYKPDGYAMQQEMEHIEKYLKESHI